MAMRDSGAPGLDLRRGHRQRREKASAGRTDVERAGPGGADRVRDERRGGRHQLVGGGGGDDRPDRRRADRPRRAPAPGARRARHASSRRSSGSAIRRERIPVRRTIQSSWTPSRAPTSALETACSGTLTPTDAATAPRRGAVTNLGSGVGCALSADMGAEITTVKAAPLRPPVLRERLQFQTAGGVAEGQRRQLSRGRRRARRSVPRGGPADRVRVRARPPAGPRRTRAAGRAARRAGRPAARGPASVSLTVTPRRSSLERERLTIARRSSASRIRVAVEGVIPASAASSRTRAVSRLASACSSAYCDSVRVSSRLCA